MTKYDGILFDLDGTLWDSTEEVAKSWQQAIEETPGLVSRPTLDDFMGVMGLTDVALMKKLFPELSEAEGLRLFDKCCVAENAYLLQHGAKGYEGVPEMLAALSKEHKLAVVSNCNKGYIEAYLEAMDTGKYISDHLCFGDTRKPKGENIRLVVERNGFQNPVYVGDTIWDMEAATLAGIPFIWAAYGFGSIEADVPTALSPAELIALIL